MIVLYAGAEYPPILKGHVRDLRALWALEETGLPYQIKYIDMGKGEHKEAPYRAINPFGKIPAIADDGRPLFESGAIIWHLATTSGKLLPSGEWGRAQALQWAFCALNTVETPFLELFAADIFAKDAPDYDHRRKRAHDYVEQRLQIMDAHFKANDFVMGKEFMAPDILMAHALNFMSHTDVYANFPHSKTYMERCHARPAFLRALARQKAKAAA